MKAPRTCWRRRGARIEMNKRGSAHIITRWTEPVKEEIMKKRFDPILPLLIAAGIGAVMLAWWLLMQSIASAGVCL